MPTSTVDSNVSCAVTIAPINDHQVPFYLTSATGGLQEALNQNFTTPQANTVILDNVFYELVGGAANAAAVIAAAQGSTKLGLMDVTQVPTVWYQWNGTQYVKVSPYRQRRQSEHAANDLVSIIRPIRGRAGRLRLCGHGGGLGLQSAGSGHRCRRAQRLGDPAARRGTNSFHQHGQLSGAGQPCRRARHCTRGHRVWRGLRYTQSLRYPGAGRTCSP